MGLFSSSSNKQYVELVCDIGNGSVGVALVSHSSLSKTPNIIYTERIATSTKHKKSIENTISALNNNLKTLLNKSLGHCVSKNLKPSRVSCFYSSPWFISQTNILNIKHSEPIVFSESIIKKVLEEGERDFLSGDSTKNNFLPSEDLRIIERKITRIKLNGYQTHDPLGKKASNIEVALFLSAIPKETLVLVEGSIDRFWHKIKIHHHTFPLASFSMLRNEFSTQSSFFIVQISENITDVSIVNDGMLLDTFTFPFGQRNMIEGIENKCSLDYELASSALSMYAKGEIHSESSKQFGDAIDLIKKDWIEHFENACNILTKKTVIPSSIFLITDSKMVTFFEVIIKDFGFNSYAMANKELKVYTVAKDIFSKYLTYSKPAHHKDIFLETDILYSDLITTKDEKIIYNYIID